MKTKLIKIQEVWVNPSRVICVHDSIAGCRVTFLGIKIPVTFSMTAEQFAEALNYGEE